MKNRMHTKEKNGKFWCRHKWEVAEKVGRNWDVVVDLKILCRCKNCEKTKRRLNYLIDEVPDKFISDCIQYDG